MKEKTIVLPTEENVVVMKTATNDCEPECKWLKGEDASFILYIYKSGSTNKPKGVMHATAAMLYAATTFKVCFDYLADDIYWCTADVG